MLFGGKTPHVVIFGRMPALVEHSSNTAGRKRKSFDENDDEIMAGTATDWHTAAKLAKKPKPTPSPLVSPPTWQDDNPGLEEDDLRGRILQHIVDHAAAPVRFPGRPELRTTRRKWTADPTKLPPKQKGKKLKYYGVLFGVEPGIYYTWDEAEAQVKGIRRAVYISSTEAREIEDFMNHGPSGCRWATCAKRCFELSPLGDSNVAISYPRIPREPATTILAETSTPSSFRETTSNSVCHCANPENMGAPTVQCANSLNCHVGTYHKKCVGLATRKETAGWRCVSCRPTPSSIKSISSQAPLDTQISSSSFSEFESVQRKAPAGTTGVNPLLTAEPEPPLHPEQEAVVEAIMQGHNVFYTGSAGVGKSTVLKNFVSRLRTQNKKIDIIAPSGIAALNVGGMTTYSYAGWTPDSFKEPLENLVAAAHGTKIRKRLGKTDVLVVDEISMVERDMFVRLDRVMRAARHGWRDDENPRGKQLSVHRADAPFGGVQLVVTGDFCQLPPVKPFRFCIYCGGDELVGYNISDGRPLTCRKCKRQYLDKDKWAFQCEEWANCDFLYFELAHVHRQSDLQFINILQKCRYDEKLLPSEKALLTKPKPDPLGAVKLLPRRVEVEAESASKFRLLQGTIREYECLDIFSWRNQDELDLKKKGRPRYADQSQGPLEALKDHRYEEMIKLRVGMLVILLCNLSFEDGLVNGSQGKIIGFETYNPKKPVTTKPREASPSRSGKGGRDNTLHLERVEFQDAQIRKFIEKAQSREWPIVQFNNGITRPIYAQCPITEVGIEKPYSLLARTQIPLIAAWAITIHKSQGLSLDKVIVNLQNTFEREQVREIYPV